MKFTCIKKTSIGKGMVAVGLVGLMVLTGCATTSGPAATAPSQPLTPEQQVEIVKKRFQERWDAMIAKDYAKAYEYLSPATRALVSREKFAVRLAKGNFKKAEFEEAKCEEDACLVRFSLTYDYKNFHGVTTPAAEKWFFRDGEAWFNLPE